MLKGTLEAALHFQKSLFQAATFSTFQGELDIRPHADTNQVGKAHASRTQNEQAKSPL